MTQAQGGFGHVALMHRHKSPARLWSSRPAPTDANVSGAQE
jgi:hypothetical protein